MFRVLVREIFAGWVLLSLTDILADPYILNALIILATGDETMAQLPATPDYKVSAVLSPVYVDDCIARDREIYCRFGKMSFVNNLVRNSPMLQINIFSKTELRVIL